jgi:hypothetical protein
MDGRELFHFETLLRICAIARRFQVVALKVQDVGVEVSGEWIIVNDEQLRPTQGDDEKRSTDRGVRHGIVYGGLIFKVTCQASTASESAILGAKPFLDRRCA